MTFTLEDVFLKSNNEACLDRNCIRFIHEHFFLFFILAVGMVVFEERLGCFNNPPSLQAQMFLKNLLGFFKTMQPLMYNLPVYKLWPTSTWKEYKHHSDHLVDIGLALVHQVLYKTFPNHFRMSWCISHTRPLEV